MRLGASAPSISASASSNQTVEPSLVPPHELLLAPTGTTPSDSTTSGWDQPSATTRWGSSSMVVSP